MSVDSNSTNVLARIPPAREPRQPLGRESFLDKNANYFQSTDLNNQNRYTIGSGALPSPTSSIFLQQFSPTSVASITSERQSYDYSPETIINMQESSIVSRQQEQQKEIENQNVHNNMNQQVIEESINTIHGHEIQQISQDEVHTTVHELHKETHQKTPARIETQVSTKATLHQQTRNPDIHITAPTLLQSAQLFVQQGAQHDQNIIIHSIQPTLDSFVYPTNQSNQSKIMEQKTENTNPVIFGVGTSSLQMVEQAIKSQSTNALNIHSGNSQRLGFMSTNVTATQRSTIENKSRTFVQKTVDIIRNKRQKNREETIFDQSAVIVAQLLEKGRKELTGKKKIKNEAIFHLTQEIIAKQLDKFNQQLDNVEASKQIMKKLNNSHTKHLQEIFSAREEEAQLTKELKEQGVEVDKMTLFFDTSDLNEEEEDNEVQKSIEVNDEDEEEDEEEEEEEQTRHKRKRNTVQQQKPIKRPRTQ